MLIIMLKRPILRRGRFFNGTALKTPELQFYDEDDVLSSGSADALSVVGRRLGRTGRQEGSLPVGRIGFKAIRLPDTTFGEWKYKEVEFLLLLECLFNVIVALNSSRWNHFHGSHSAPGV